MYGTNYFSERPDSFFDVKEMEPERIEVSQFTTRDLGRTIVDGRGEGNLLTSAAKALRQGTNVMEFQPGTPGEPGVSAEAIGREVRRQTREMLRLNDAQIQSIHAPPQMVGNVSGWNPQQQRFDEMSRRSSIQEVKKHIDLAADIQGGAIVFHTNEFPRSNWQKFGRENSEYTTKNGEKVEFYPVIPNQDASEEEKKAAKRDTIYFVDEKTGKTVTAFEKGQKITVIAPESKEWIDQYEKKLQQEALEFERMSPEEQRKKLEEKREAEKNGTAEPEFDLKLQTKSILDYENDFEGDRASKIKKEYAERYNKNAKVLGMYDKYGIKENEIGEKITPERAILIDIFENHMSETTSTVERYSKELSSRLKNLKLLEKQYNSQKNLEEGAFSGDIDVDEESLKEPNDYGVMVFRSEKMREMIERSEGEVEYIRDAIEKAKKKADEVFQNFTSLKTAEEYGKDASWESLSELGLYAYEKTKEQKDKGEKLERPIYVAPENIFPQYGYGSHLSELRELVEGGRKKMIEKLMKDHKMDSKKAAKIANQSIRATLDTQHLGMWKAHFPRKKNETTEEWEARFDDWYMDQVKRLAAADVIGNMHIVDGFEGHTHVAIGEGSLRVVDAVNAVKSLTKGPLSLNSESYEDQQNQQQLMQQNIWRAFGVPMTNINATAGIDFINAQGTWVTYGDEKMVSSTTKYNVGKGIPEFKQETYQNWDGLPLE